MQNFKGMLAEFYDQASMLLGLPDISFSPPGRGITAHWRFRVRRSIPAMPN